ncbi:MAG: hypothetical protein Q9184_006446, partial [Pyrenodesmia sp. 2 TL-2023]
MEKLQGTQTGVFVGNMGANYADIVSQDLDTLPTYFASVTARSILSNRISYFFDWRGPSVMIDTACSSSLVAVHQALGADKAADGYARGEGFAAVVLKTMGAAVADGDHIECLIRETGVNQDGRTKGTPAGDPVEAEAIATAFHGSHPDFDQAGEKQKLLVGSVKTVIGHTEGTAGLASLLKASLALQRKEIAPNLHLECLNPAVKPFYSNLEIPTTLQPWPQLSAAVIRRASVNSFGFGGANAHAILEAYAAQQNPRGPPNTIFSPFLFSASSDRALSAMLEAHAKYLQAHPDVDLRDLAYTLHTRRSLAERDKMLRPGHFRAKPRILGIFTGQGAQWARMGAEIIESSPIALKILDELQQSLMTLPLSDRPSWSIVDELLKGKASSKLNEAQISQPLCTALQVMLVVILREAGVSFDAVIGHSSGEIAAAYAAGVISASDAIRIAYYRGFHLYSGQGPKGKQGAMMAVGTTFEDAEELCRVDDYRGRLCVAASNSSTSVTLSGDADAIEEAKDVLASEDKFVRQLKVDKAYHSHYMVPCSEPYVRSLQGCGINAVTPESNGCQWMSLVYAENIVQTVEAVTGDLLPYAACLSRGKDGVEALAEGLGRIWADQAANVLQEGKNSVSMVENASCDISVRFGDMDDEALPPRPVNDCQMFDLEVNRFYNAVGRLGYGYTGPFRALSGLTRKLDFTAGFIAVPETTPSFEKLLVHPAQLDAAIQSMILAYCYPGDTSLRTIQLPTGIDCIRFNVPLCASTAPGTNVPFRSSVAPGDSGENINGDVDVFATDGRTTIIQLGDELDSERELFGTVERVAYFYLRNLDHAIPKNAREGLLEHQTRLFQQSAHVRREFSQDTHEDVLRLIAQHPTSIDLQLMHAVGENWPAIIKGEMNMLEPMVENNMLNRFYTDALGMERYLQDLTRMARQLSHRYPYMSVLEVGAGTGGATEVILRELDDAFGSYCYTDISTGFFNVAQETFRTHEAKMTFKALDIEKDIGEQGFDEQTYDLLIANLVVHATKKLEDTMRNLRRLLKPGGYLLLLEITDNEPLRFGFIFGGLPGWWLGHEERPLSPCVDVPTWNEVMRKTGFSGVDSLTGHVETCPLSVILTQAVDDRVRFMREPLSATKLPELSKAYLTIVGGVEAKVSHLGETLRALLAPMYSSVTVLSSVEHVLVHDMAVMGSVMVLSDLDQPIFNGITQSRFQALQQIFRRSRNVS